MLGTWSTFDDVTAAYSTGEWAAIGFALSDADDLLGIDIGSGANGKSTLTKSSPTCSATTR
jgi:primase-polymerase (primpol)-like protein